MTRPMRDEDVSDIEALAGRLIEAVLVTTNDFGDRSKDIADGWSIITTALATAAVSVFEGAALPGGPVMADGTAVTLEAMLDVFKKALDLTAEEFSKEKARASAH